jgi:hypothetical protein
VVVEARNSKEAGNWAKINKEEAEGRELSRKEAKRLEALVAKVEQEANLTKIEQRQIEQRLVVLDMPRSSVSSQWLSRPRGAPNAPLGRSPGFRAAHLSTSDRMVSGALPSSRLFTNRKRNCWFSRARPISTRIDSRASGFSS